MTLFRRLQTLFGVIVMAICLLPYSVAQQKAALPAPRQRHATVRGAMQDIETLFALAANRMRKPLQEYARSQKQAGSANGFQYQVFEIGSYARRYRIADWKPMRAIRGTEGGLAGDWAEVAEKGENLKGVSSDQGGWSLYHRLHGRWQRVASHEGIGYEPDAIRKARVPRQIIQRLKLEINE